MDEAVAHFLEAAEAEYDALARYSDSVAKLSHAVSDANKREPLSLVGVGADGGAAVRVWGDGGPGASSAGGGSRVSNKITAAFQRAAVPTAAAQLYIQIDSVREAHAFMLDAMDDAEDEARALGCDVRAGTGSGRANARERQCERRYGALRTHAERSHRVVKTICSCGVGIPVIHPNGMLATDDNADGNGAGSAQQQDSRIVALAALRASIARVKQVA